MKADVKIRHSARAKSLQLKVTHIGEVIVVIPKNFRHVDVNGFLAEHQSWIETRLQHIKKRRILTAEVDSLRPAAIDLMAKEKSFQVNYQKGNRDIIEPFANALAVQYKDEKRIPQQLRAWLQNVAKDWLTRILEDVSESTGLDFNKATIRGQRTRWGSCTSKGNISLNRNLLFLEPQLVEYLMLHELCHTRHLNHSADYWHLVSSFEPNYKVLEKKLNSASRFVPVWALSR